MSVVEPPHEALAPAEAVVPPDELDSIGAAARAYVERLKAGDVGSLPVILGMVVIVIFFTAQSSAFFTAVNFNNLIVQMAGTTVVAIGVVFVLLLGEIDLSIGYVSGVAGVTVAWLQEPGTSHQLPGILAILAAIAVGAVIGVFQGSFVAFIGVPSFVVTLAGLLAWQGVIIRWIGDQGVIGIQDNLINDVANYVLPTWLGWLLALAVVVAFGASVASGFYSRHRHGLKLRSVPLAVLRVAFVAVVVFGVVAICNQSRGVPFAGVLVVTLLAFWSFVANRTTFGRHVYAVGGNAEAAHRAGINVKFIRVAVFAISSGMAAIGGIIFASRLNSVDLTAGGGTILLDAIAAAVIGGTSLFGGRGRVVSALLGALVISTIGNGLSLIGSAAATQYITTGVILLAAVVLDTVSRRRLAASGR
jgi:D-xylose transport system permease protein